MKIQDIPEFVKQKLQDDPSSPLAPIDFIVNDYDSDLINREVVDVLNARGIAVILYVFGSPGVSNFNVPVAVTASVIEVAVQRERFLGGQPGLRALGVVHEIISKIANTSAPRCGNKPLRLVERQPFERIAAESGRVQFDIRLLADASVS